MKKKRQHKSKYSVRKKAKYQSGGSMYADNTVQSAGQGSVGTTANIVFQESNPAILEAKLQKLQESKTDAISKNEQMQSDIERQDLLDKQNVALAEQESNKQFETGENIAKQGVEAYDKFKDGAAAIAANKAKKEFTAKAAKSIAGKEFGNVARKKSAEEVTKILSKDLVGEGAEIALSNTSGGSSGLLTAFNAPPPVMPTPPVGVVPPAPVSALGSEAVKKGSQEVIKKGAEAGANVGSNVAGTTSGVVGGAGVGSGLAKFATSGAGIGTIASLAGTGISMLSDDGDPTKSNFGEYSGSILSSAGTGASIGSLLGPVGTAVGGAVGALYGAGKQFFGTRKAKREEARLAKIKKKKTDKYNKQLVDNLATANAQARAAEQKQKTYSGYDLGRNVVARYGGNRLQMPSYA
tara:strand:- start:1596 stop:2822 length:1227 start_codon:yes stop_codon:yes gene_type:complete